MKQVHWTVFAASLAGLAASAGGVSAGHVYPEVTRVTTAPIQRPCTQFELSAGVDRDQCGALTVAQVIEQVLADQDD